MRCVRIATLAVLLAVGLAGCAAPTGGRDVLYQTSTIGALLEGAYDGDVTVGRLKRQGDFGLGTFDALDGEMVVLDGVVYKVSADGKARVAGDGEKTPFAAVAFFRPEMRFGYNGLTLDMRRVERLLDAALPTKNVPYAVRITGTFAYVKTRSVPRQVRPYPPLAAVVRNQPTFAFDNAAGTIVAIRCPGYMKGLNVPGWHMHFLTAERTRGGHVLDCRLGDAVIEIDRLDAVRVDLPRSGRFWNADLAGDRGAELHQVER